MTARDKFNGIKADFWDCDDSEQLKHIDPISALEDWVGSHIDPGRPLEEIIREMGEITIEAYLRARHSDTEIDDAIDRAIDNAREALDDETEHGDPDGEIAMFTVDVLAKHRPAFEAAVRALAADARVWQCEFARGVDLSPDETIEILRVERPEWFEPAPAGGAGLPEDL